VSSGEPADLLEAWDRAYVLKVEQTAEEYVPSFVAGASGAWLHMSDGRKLLDFCSQYMCMGVGHGHPRIRAALHEAVDGLGFVSEMLGHEGKARAARMLIEETMEGSDWAGAVKFVSTGSEAVEAAMLLARLETNRPAIVVAQNAYHGWTAGAAAATNVPFMQQSLERPAVAHSAPVPLHGGSFFPAPSPLGCEGPESIGRCLEETERFLRSVGPLRIAALMVEVWHGASAYMAPAEYVKGIREICDRLGILLIFDEAIAGSGRTGRWWSFQHSGVEPDIMCTAKGLSSSAAPVGAVVVSKEIARSIDSGRLVSFSTFSGHPLGVAAVAATIETINSEGVLENVRDVGAYLFSGLETLASRHPSVGSVHGIGLGIAVELVKDPVTGERWVPQDRWWTPHVDPEPALMPSALVAEKCKERDVLLFDFLPNTVSIAPPLLLSRVEADVGLVALDHALSALDERIDG
jgi:taurine--2-oxoglutarate transaminase